MSRGTEYLDYVTEQLALRLKELDATIQDVREDIAGMNEYYWENYAEMDEYGYENYDNQQALISQVNAGQEYQKQRHRWEKMLDSPFFGSVDFVYEREEETETFYIGIGNFARKRGAVPLIYDWRAPVSGLFYDYDKGAAAYEAPGGTMKGEILSKWQYKIRGGHMVYEFESDMKIDDDILKQELSTNSDVQLKNIVRTIQKEQNAIIRNTRDKVLIIQGTAGSGKTSIALHRIAYLLYHDRENLKSSNILVLSPNSVFSDYISHILPELGEENIQEMSLDLFAYRELKDVASDCEDRWHQIERQIRKDDADADRRYRWKQSAEFVEAAEGFLIELEDRLVDFKDVRYKGMEKKADEILKMFYLRFQEIPLLSRMDAVMEYFTDEFETLQGKDIPEEDMEFIHSQFQSMYATTDLYVIYSWFLEEYGWQQLADLPCEKRILAYEDVYPLLYLKQRLLKVTRHKNIRHLVIDEMQDYSYLQYVIIERMFSCRMTILGDRAQTLDGLSRDVTAFLPKILGKKVRKIELNRSYRNTCEIAEYANRIAGLEGIEYVKRQGREVEEVRCASMEDAAEKALAQVRLGEEGYETAAFLVMTEDEARALCKIIEAVRKDVSYIDRDSSVFRKGITVTTFYMAKGLEFDQVFIFGRDRENPFFRQFCYICATRALHELWVMEL